MRALALVWEGEKADGPLHNVAGLPVLASAVPTGPGEATDCLGRRVLCVPSYLLTLFQAIKLSLLGQLEREDKLLCKTDLLL